MPFSFGDEPANFGDSASVQCSVTSGDFPIHIRWLFNGLTLTGDSGVSTSQVGKRSNALNIDFVEASHAGNYTCEAANDAAIVNFTVQLVVNGYLTMVFF